MYQREKEMIMRTVKFAMIILMLGTVIFPQKNNSPGSTEWDEGGDREW